MTKKCVVHYDESIEYSQLGNKYDLNKYFEQFRMQNVGNLFDDRKIWFSLQVLLVNFLKPYWAIGFVTITLTMTTVFQAGDEIIQPQ